MNIVAEPLSRKSIGNIAYALRKLVGFEKEKFFPIAHFIEWVLLNPDNDFGLEFEILEVDEMDSAYGVTNTGRNRMQIREDVYDRVVEGNPRDRFTLCHELGHYILHRPENIAYARGRVPTYRDPEWQANVFAAELLAPSRLVTKMEVGEIMEECGISRQAAEIQYAESKK